MVRNCPICNNDKVTFLFKQNFNNDTISLMESYYVVSCDRCNMIYAYDIPSQEEFNKYYKEMSKYEYHNNNGMISDGYKNHFKNIFKFIQPHITKESKILDIGCATGALLNEFKENGYKNVLGIEPSEQCTKVAMEQYGIEVSNNFNNMQEGVCDLIILSSVLEHIIDIESFIKNISKLLSKDGILFISVPNVDNFYLQKTNCFQQFSTEHVNFFTQITLYTLFYMYDFDLLAYKEDTNELSKTINYDIFALYKRVREENSHTLFHDYEGVRNIQKYISKNLKEEFELSIKVKEKLKDIDDYIIWGVGASTLRLLDNGIDIIKIVFFIDSNEVYQNKFIRSISILSPESDKLQYYYKIPIVIISYAYTNEIKEQINKLGLKNEVISIYE
jgi:2-polyprenyl-3-methyl-5-hydroxy-6-metoxy-1,4-benzoquinol methylase